MILSASLIIFHITYYPEEATSEMLLRILRDFFHIFYPHIILLFIYHIWLEAIHLRLWHIISIRDIFSCFSLVTEIFFLLPRTV